MQIPAGCDDSAVYETLKHNFQETYGKSPWFQVNLHGFGTHVWCLDARLNIGATILHRNFRAKKSFEGRSLKVLMPTSLLNFNARLSLEQFSSFKAKLNKTPKMLLIDEDLAPLADKKLGVSPANLLNQPRHATWATCQPEGCVDGHTTNESIFFLQFTTFFPHLVAFFPTLLTFFPNSTFAWARQSAFISD